MTTGVRHAHYRNFRAGENTIGDNAADERSRQMD